MPRHPGLEHVGAFGGVSPSSTPRTCADGSAGGRSVTGPEETGATASEAWEGPHPAEGRPGAVSAGAEVLAAAPLATSLVGGGDDIWGGGGGDTGTTEWACSSAATAPSVAVAGAGADAGLVSAASGAVAGSEASVSAFDSAAPGGSMADPSSPGTGPPTLTVRGRSSR